MRVILVRLSALGDIIHTWPLAETLSATVPDLHLTWVVEEPLVRLVEGHPAVDAVVAVATRRWRRSPFSGRTLAEIALVRGRLRELNADVCLDAQGLVKSALVARWSGATERIGLARPWRREALAGLAYTRTVPGSLDDLHVIASNVALVRAFGFEPPRPTPKPDGRWLLGGIRPGAKPGDVDRPYGVLLPGAGHPSKVIPVEVLTGAADHLAGRGIEPIVAWGPGERTRAVEIVEASGGRARLAPPTDIYQLAALLGGAAAVVGADTGPIHLSASLGSPTLAVHLASSPIRNGPRGDRVAVVSAVASDRPGPRGAARARRSGPLDLGQVVAAIDRLLDSRPPLRTSLAGGRRLTP